MAQWIDVTDVPAGDYTLVVATNWHEQTRNLTSAEIDYSNNEARVPIRLTSDGVEALDGNEDSLRLSRCLR